MPKTIVSTPLTTAELDAQIRDIESEVRQLESRKKELEQVAAQAWDNPDPATREEYTSLLYRLNTAPHRIQMLQDQRRGIEIIERQAAREALLPQFQAKADLLKAIQEEMLYQKARATIQHNAFGDAKVVVKNEAVKITDEIHAHNRRLTVLKAMTEDEVERMRALMNRALSLDGQIDHQATNIRRQEAKTEFEELFRDKFGLEIDIEVPPV